MFLSLLLEAELGATWGLQLPLFSVHFPSHRLHLTATEHAPTHSDQSWYFPPSSPATGRLIQ